MNTLILIFVYIAVTLVVQALGFGISRVVDYQYPTISLMVFLMLFLAAFYVSWPIAVRIAERFMKDEGLENKPTV